MTDAPITDPARVEVILRVAFRRVGSGRTPHGSDRKQAEQVLLALADAQLDRVAESGFDAAAAEALDALRRHLIGGGEGDGIASATIARPDHHGGWACRLDTPWPQASASALAAIARSFRGNRRFAAIAVETSPWQPASPGSPGHPDTSLGDRMILLDREHGDLDDLRDTARICEALRRAIMARCPVQPVPPWIGGHHDDGRVLDRDHLACIALPQWRADRGWRLGAAALLVPRDVSEERIRRDLLPALDADSKQGPLRLWDRGHPALDWKLRRRIGGAAEAMLQEEWWRGQAAGARRWASVTPAVMDRHGSRVAERRDAIERSCHRLGLPSPVHIDLGRESAVPNVPVAGSFPMSTRPGRPSRQQWHVHVAFDRPVRGPIVLGAGRYRGYGLLMPIDDPAGDDGHDAQ